MKTLFLFVGLVMATCSLQAQKMMTRTGHIWFFSETPVENIEAHNNQVSSVLDGESGALVFAVLMKGFQFEKALMQEHFNEKYVHSDKYPKATFKGKVVDMSGVNLSEDGTYEVEVAGTMNLHGVDQDIKAPGQIVVKDGKATAKADFPLTLEDYKIKIPGAVKDKIAETITIHVDVAYNSGNP
ncbi:YceI family protein [Pontibacter sp. G13]|uniref:YceI family protein n=1 Tax=Pontibacter sp. G13 TaxID=3074898 RepID=UPI00288A0EC5|nr:YceI family protein [Pontibacter sp. G13]WNJ18118.1 YceI family protein [Pontibacter sp. G13]